ncbi:hypothetical protein JTB14_025515 [Gonioctena quinquepunctata]|nr:hypothetical protein JTB14_025515 [Gonioctena quinquepunctata]
MNAKAHQWGSPVVDVRGEYMVEWIGTPDLVVHNRRDKPTFLRGGRQSWVDVTCSTQGIARYLKGWRILDDEPVSDHALIAYELAGKAGNQNQRHVYTTDWDAFTENLTGEYRAAWMRTLQKHAVAL